MDLKPVTTPNVGIEESTSVMTCELLTPGIMGDYG